MKKYFRKPTLSDVIKHLDSTGPIFIQLAALALIIHVFKDMGLSDVVFLAGLGLLTAFVSGVLQAVRELKDERKGTADKT